MPKERIFGTQAPDNHQAVEVGWSRGLTVDLGVTSPEPFRFAGGEEFDSLWINLDRTAINRLIATLRRARDAAFGRDE